MQCFLSKSTESKKKSCSVQVGKWSLENAGQLVFDRRLGCLEDADADAAAEWGRKMVEANKEIFRLSGELKLSMPFYRVVSTPK